MTLPLSKSIEINQSLEGIEEEIENEIDLNLLDDDLPRCVVAEVEQRLSGIDDEIEAEIDRKIKHKTASQDFDNSLVIDGELHIMNDGVTTVVKET